MFRANCSIVDGSQAWLLVLSMCFPWYSSSGGKRPGMVFNFFRIWPFEENYNLQYVTQRFLLHSACAARKPSPGYLYLNEACARANPISAALCSRLARLMCSERKLSKPSSNLKFTSLIERKGKVEGKTAFFTSPFFPSRIFEMDIKGKPLSTYIE